MPVEAAMVWMWCHGCHGWCWSHTFARTGCPSASASLVCLGHRRRLVSSQSWARQRMKWGIEFGAQRAVTLTYLQRLCFNILASCCFRHRLLEVQLTFWCVIFYEFLGQMGQMVIWSSSVPGVSFAEWSNFTDVMRRAQGVQRFGDNGRRRHRRRERLRHHGIVATADVASLPSLHQNDWCSRGEDKQDIQELKGVILGGLMCWSKPGAESEEHLQGQMMNYVKGRPDATCVLQHSNHATWRLLWGCQTGYSACWVWFKSARCCIAQRFYICALERLEATHFLQKSLRAICTDTSVAEASCTKCA